MSPTVRNGRGERETYVVDLVGSPASAVERRQAADHEREGFAPGRVSPGLSSATPRHLTEASLARPAVVNRQKPDQLHASRMRGAARHLEVVAAARVLGTVTGPTVTARTIEEEPVMAIERPVETQSHLEQDPPSLANAKLEGLRAIATAVDEAIAATEAYHAAGARLAAAEQAVDEAWARATRKPIAAVPESFREEERPNGAPYVPRAVSEPANVITGSIPDDPADDAPEIVARRAEAPVAAGGGPGGRPPFVARMLEALVANDGDFTLAANDAGIKRTSLVGSMAMLRKRADLTDAERAAVARKRG